MTKEDEKKEKLINDISRALNKEGIKYIEFIPDGARFYKGGLCVELKITKDRIKAMKG